MLTNFEPKPFGKYYLTDSIAIGGMAEIYKAKTFGVDGFEKILAIKKILTHYSADKEFITMLTDEAKLVVNLTHANIVQVYDLGRVGDDYFISMEFIDGINLRDLIEKSKERKEAIPADIAIFILSEVCRGLDYAHNKKDQNGQPLQIVHRDISPQNILVSHEGGVKIVDFGIAKAAMNLSQTNIGTLKGKVTYMAPEQAFGKPIDGRTDLFSAGIVLFELLTRERLFTGESQMEILKKIRNTKITEKNISPNIPVHIRPIVAKALAYAVKDRYQSAADMQIALTKALYVHYPDFNPRKLVELLHDWFKTDIQNKLLERDLPKDPSKETILVSSAAAAQTSAKLLDDKTKAAVVSAADDLPEVHVHDTLGPDDEIKPASFKTNPEESTEKTEKSDLSNNPSSEKSVAQLLQLKHRRTWAIRFGLVLLTLLSIFLVWKMLSDNTEIPDDDDFEPAKEEEIRKFNVSVITEPANTKIYLDDKLISDNSPATLSNLEEGSSHKLKLISEGFVEQIESLQISEATPKELQFSLKKLSYNVNVASTPAGAEIFLDGNDLKLKTPATVSDLIPGQKYSVQLKLEGYEDTTQDIISATDQPQEISATLQKSVQHAQFNVHSSPAGAEIWIDGKSSGFVTPHEFTDLAKGKYTISLKLKDHKETIESIELKSGNNPDLNQTLQKIETPPVVPDKPPVIVVKPVEKPKTPPATPKVPPVKPVQPVKPPVEPKVQTPPPVKENFSNVSATGSLRIDSTPRGASVRINGSARGITPIVVSSLPKNTPLSVTVTKSGFRPWSTSVTLTRDKMEIKANLSP